MQTLLWLDDERDPSQERWASYFPIKDASVQWVKSHLEFVDWIQANSLPDAVCFDHDLGDGLSGMDCAKWLVNFCLDEQLMLPLWNIQSANPIGKRNIAALLGSFERIQAQADDSE